MSIVGYQTAKTLINRAAVQFGLGAVADPFASTDPSFVQLVEFLASVGEDLSAKVKTPQVKEYTFVTAASATTYDLPADYVEMVDETGWDRTGQSALDGPVSSQRRAFLKAWGVTSTVAVEYILEDNRITFPIAPADGLTIALEYVSSYWVASNGVTTPDKATPTLQDDVICFDPLLVVRALKLQLAQAKAMDTTVHYAEYIDRLTWVTGKVRGGRRLSLAGGRKSGQFLSEANIPDTGYGSP